MIAFLISIPPLALILTLVFTRGDKIHIRLLRFFGVLVSSIPIVGILHGFMIKARAPEYAKACFIQAAYCGVGILIVY